MSFGALVATMIATSGDEAYVMFSLFPIKALLLNIVLFIVAILSGYLVDLVYKRQDVLLSGVEHELKLHQPEVCHCLQKINCCLS